MKLIFHLNCCLEIDQLQFFVRIFQPQRSLGNLLGLLMTNALELTKTLKLKNVNLNFNKLKQSQIS